MTAWKGGEFMDDFIWWRPHHLLANRQNKNRRHEQNNQEWGCPKQFHSKKQFPNTYEATNQFFLELTQLPDINQRQFTYSGNRFISISNSALNRGVLKHSVLHTLNIKKGKSSFTTRTVTEHLDQHRLTFPCSRVVKL